MGTGKTYSTKYLLDSNNSSGVAGQVLSTTSTGIDWVDANTVPGAGLWLANGSDIYNSNSGNVGIGTTLPGRKLTVTGDVSGDANNLLLSNENDTDGDSASIGFSMLSNNTYVKSGIFFKRTTTQGRGDLIFATNNEVNGNNVTLSDARITIQANGNVGIGVTDPQAKLEVMGASATPADGNEIISVTNTTGGSKLLLGVVENSYGWIQSAEGGTLRDLLLNPSGGNVGIGTTGPGAKLELKKQTTWGTLDNQVIYINNTGTGGDTSLIHDMGSITWRSGNVNTAAISGIRNTPGSGNNVDLRFTTATQSGGQQTSMTILSGGNVGIGDTSPTAKLDVNGSVQATSFYNLANPSPIMFPEGGTYNGVASETGYIVIKLPDTNGAGTNNMMTCLVRIFDYATNESFDVRFNGYFYGSSYLWTRTTVWIDSSAIVDRNFTVRFGKELGSSGTQDRAVVTIGETGSTWSYPKVAVIQYTPGHSEGNQPQLWNSGWNVSVVADYWDGTDNTLDDTIVNNQVNNWRRNGQDVYYGSGTGNVGIATTTPQKKLHIEGTGAASEMQILVSGASDTVGHTAGIGLRAEGGESNSSVRVKGGIFFERIAGSFGNGKMILAVNSSVSNASATVADHAITIDTNKNVGIGNTSPDKLLHVGDGLAQLGSPQGAIIEGYNDTLDLRTNEGNSIADFTAALNLFCDGVVGSSGTGTGIYFRAKTGGGGGGEYTKGRIQGAVYTSWTTNTDATRTSKLVIQTTNSGTHADRVTILGNGDFGINDTSPSNKLDVNGDIRGTQYKLRGNVSNPTSTAATIYDQSSVGLTLSAHNVELRNYNGSSMVRSVFFTHNSATFTGSCTATNFILSSDKTLKENIKDIDKKHIDVNWKNFELKSEPGIKRAGVIAQELETKHPEFVRTNEDGLKSVAYVDLLIAKIAELEARLEKAGI